MKQRIITGLVGAVGFLYVVKLGGIPYSLLVILLAILAYFEYLKMSSTKIYSIEGLIGLGTALSIIISHNKLFTFFLDIDEVYIMLSALFLYLVIVVTKKNKITFDKVGFYLLGAMYIGFGFSYMLETRFLNNGLALTLFILFLTWASDTGAYFSGKYFGKNKLWPEISPKKTIEGSIGAIVSTILVGLFLNVLLEINDDILQLIWFGILISIVGQFGDLVESALKRSKDVKDSGSILPGHGGILDRFDSLIFIFLVLHLFRII
ncbi:hypothetical protein BHF71_00565 [Vulcanibacillus modesticaldus]|uniref:Phosphatidate cytidylyltransferase n=1 Tax=Vulcanibacillus modesticaldus TaxID=337097 RepID=A0A1D2YXK1_9BACI|nr:phosphatidate cytidylyltransferase [Vulcanibacillus modesticaldus]OEG00434.1 hypothetical protein BHF71_00565 [Vulcanibacillus modesticaldus]